VLSSLAQTVQNFCHYYQVCQEQLLLLSLATHWIESGLAETLQQDFLVKLRQS
jgi:hypothetical protein